MMMLMSILTVGMVSVFTACSDDLDLVVDGESVELDPETDNDWGSQYPTRLSVTKP